MTSHEKDETFGCKIPSPKTLPQITNNVPIFTVFVLVGDTENILTYKEYQRIGLTRKGQIDLKQITSSRDHKKRKFRDTFYNRSAMLTNEWNFDRHDYETNEVFSIVKTVVTNQQDYSNPQSFSKQAKKFTKTVDVVSYEVERLECDFGSYSIEMDEVTFPKGDPHFTCTINYKSGNNSTETDYRGISVCSDTSNFPIRSKLVEYFYRHDRQFYDELIKNNIIPNHEYFISLTLNQIEEANKRSDVEDIMAMVAGIYYQTIQEYDTSLLIDNLDDAQDDEL